MEKAIYQGKIITASEVIEDINLELEIKTASKNKRLYCPDENCPDPQLKFCHGEIRSEYFAHVNNCECDYAKYDRGNTEQIRRIQRNLYSHFKKMGLNIQTDKKIISNHYTHLYYNKNENQIAIEIITQQKSASEIDRLQTIYDANNIIVCWIFIGQLNNNQTENSMMFGKRYPVNFAKNNSCIVIDSETNKIEQYRLDTYQYDETYTHGFTELYKEEASLDDLIIDNNSITLKDFDAHYHNWLEKKQSTYNKRITQSNQKNQTSHLQQNNPNTTQQKKSNSKLSYMQLLFEELTDEQKREYTIYTTTHYNYPALLLLYLEGCVPRERREYLEAIAKPSKRFTDL